MICVIMSELSNGALFTQSHNIHYRLIFHWNEHRQIYTDIINIIHKLNTADIKDNGSLMYYCKF